MTKAFNKKQRLGVSRPAKVKGGFMLKKRRDRISPVNGVVHGPGIPPVKGKPRAKKGSFHPIGTTSSTSAFTGNPLSLPRAVAPYLDIKLITNFTLQSQTTQSLLVVNPIIFVDTSAPRSTGPQLSNGIAYYTTDTSLSALANGASIYNFSNLGSLVTAGVECVPAAISIRITCPTALLNAEGQSFLGRWNVSGDPRQYAAFADMTAGFINYGHPRPLTAARLAESGVELDAVARDQNQMSDFMDMYALYGTNPTSTPGGIWPLTSSAGLWGGMTPLFFVIEPTSALGKAVYNVQIATIYRWRFDMVNPASSAHHLHPPSI